MLKTLTLILFPQLNPYHKTSARLALYIQFFGIECRIFNFYLFPISSIRKQLDKLNRIFNKTPNSHEMILYFPYHSNRKYTNYPYFYEQ